jgi:uncharacterized membrane protein YoaK (UPF0700 family)
LAGLLGEVRDTLLPRPGSRDGPLPPMLVALTLTTGLVDSFSYLVLGHVFVANMTGNVVFVAFALAGASGFSISSSIAAVAAFLVGALVAGRASSRLGKNRGRFLGVCIGIQALLLVFAVSLAALSGAPVAGGYLFGLIAALAVSMGLQNGAARKLAVPDLTTTVLTLTMVGLAEDSTLVGGPGSKAGRRVLSILSMFLGALIGAVLSLRVSIVYPVLLALAISASVAASSLLLSRRGQPWASPA